MTLTKGFFKTGQLGSPLAFLHAADIAGNKAAAAGNGNDQAFLLHFAVGFLDGIRIHAQLDRKLTYLRKGRIRENGSQNDLPAELFHKLLIQRQLALGIDEKQG